MRGDRRRATESFSLSFLDCICCGFGAIILLLVLTKIGEPIALEQAREDLDALVARLQEELFEIRGETTVLERDLVGREEQLSEEQENVARLKGDFSRVRGEFKASKQHSEVSQAIEGRLLAAQQELSEEMQRLLVDYRKPKEDAIVGGIPVDSEYIIFVVDTSGSMQGVWNRVVRKVSQTLDSYPKVKGIQVMNDMGEYMFKHYAGKWIPDTPSRREAVLTRLETWSPFSNSSPVEGITEAIRTFASPNKKISIYLFGDDFSGGRSIDDVLAEVDRLNIRDDAGNRLVRIHAVGFPVNVGSVLGATSGARFANLMRIICAENGGTFVGLNRTN
jgi:hypothetical protein